MRHFTRALVALIVIVVAGFVHAPSGWAATYANFTSESGDPIGQGVDASFGSSAVNVTGNSMSIVVSATGGESYYVSFDPRVGTPLTTGTYRPTLRISTTQYPGLDASASTRPCSSTRGRFDIYELSFAADGHPTSLSARFEAHCNGATAAFRGEIAFNAAPPPDTPDLELVETAMPTMSGYVVYTATVVNYGYTRSTPVTFSQPLPADASWYGDPTAGYGTCDQTGTCTIAGISPGHGAVISMTLRALGGTTATFVTHATVTSGSPDQNAANNSVDLTVPYTFPQVLPRYVLGFEHLNEAGFSQLYAATDDGAAQANISAVTDNDYGVTWSPDGTKVAFARDVGGNVDIYTMDALGSNLVRITTNAAIDEYPSWSPDGRTLVFDSNRGSGGNNDIYKVNVDGSGGIVRLTTDASYDDMPAFSPDGTMIAFDSDRGANYEIWVMNADGSGQRNLTNNPAVDLSRPSWSPAGTRIAFTSDRGTTGSDVWTIRLDGTDARQVTTAAGSDGNPDWSPDGRSIAFDSGRDSSHSEVYVVGLDGSGTRRITNNAVSDRLASWRGGWVLAAPLRAVAPPVVAGGSQAGSTIGATPGSWANSFSPFTTSFAWLRCDAAGGACVDTGQTTWWYILGVADVGATLKVRVTASDPADDLVADSALFGPVTAAPTPPAPTPPAPTPPTPSGGGGGGGGGSSGGAVPPNLKVSLGSQGSPGAVGDSFTYRITLANQAIQGSDSTTLRVQLPAGVELVGSKVERGGGCSVAAGLVTCPLDFFPAGLTSAVELTVQVTQLGDLVATATVSSVPADADPKDDSSTLTVHVGAPAAPLAPPASTPPSAAPSAPAVRNGSAGADRLVGSARAETFNGGSGNDTITPGGGRDRVLAGPGDDTIFARDGARDTIDCGPGRDTVFADRFDVVARNCEVVHRSR